MVLNRDTLEGKMTDIFLEIIKDSDKVDVLIEKLIKKNLDRLFITEVIYGKKDISLLSDMELFWFAECISENIENIKYKKYFSENEINEYTKAKYKGIYPIIFENIVKIANDRYLTSMRAKEIRELFDKHILVYNTETQRELVVKERRSEIVYRVDINKKSVKEIASLLDRGLYIPDVLTFNNNSDNKSAVLEIDEYAKEIVLKSGTLDIGDGMHRIMAIRKSKNDDIVFPVEICIFDTEKMNIYIAQKDKQNKLKKDYSSAIDPLNKISEIIDSINQQSRIIRGEIGRNGQGVIDRIFFSKMLDFAFKIKTKKEGLDLEGYLINNMDYFFKENIDLIEDECGESRRLDKISICLLVGALKYFYSQQKNIEGEKVRELLCNEEIRAKININCNSITSIINEVKKAMEK